MHQFSLWTDLPVLAAIAYIVLYMCVVHGPDDISATIRATCKAP